MSGRRLTVLVAVVIVGTLGVSGSAGSALPPAPPDPTCSPGPADCSAWHTAQTVTVTWALPPPGVVQTNGCTTSEITIDTAGAPVSCTWSNSEGARTTSVNVRRDATAPAVTASPSRGPDSNGWYNHGLTVAFSGSDGTSGLAGCTAPRSYAGPDTGSVTITGSCSDVAGNTNGASFPLKYDATAPSASGSVSRGPDQNGWYNQGVTVAFSGSDGLSGPVACTGGRNYTGPDSASVTVNGSCSDQAGNPSGASVSFKYDATAPSASGSPSRGPDSNGWYNHGLTIDFAGGDGVSGLAGCTGDRSYTGPDSGSVTITGSCSDVAGNTNGASFTFKYDATAPSASGSVSRGPDQNGWYNQGVTVAFSGSDGLSGPVACTGGRNYTGPDSASVTVNGSCSDQAGNPSGASVSFKYDATPPDVEARPSRAPDSNGWYNHALTIDFVGAGGPSGLAGCTAPRSYAGPDTGSVTITGSCSDVAGNTNGASFTFKYDATAPSASGSASRGPDQNGWYNHGVTINFSGSDGLSGPVACTGGRNYTGPDSASVTINGSCSDQAGNPSGASFTFKYDATAPSASGSVSRGPDQNGWYNQGVTVAFSGSDGLSGPVACTGGRNYTGPDSASVTVNGSCSDQAGNPSGASVSFKYDATAPSASGSASRGPDSNGWYNQGVAINFSGSDGVSGPVACTGGRNYTGPDSGSVTINGSCSDQAGNPSGASVSFKYDATGPAVNASPSRGPDSNGWYNHGLTVGFSGSDGLSGVAGCSAPRSYAGPDTASGTINGSCSDVAGNTNGVSFPLKYDETAPSASGSASRGPDSNGWYNQGVAINFSGSDALSGPVACTGGRNYTGPDSASVTINGSCSDQAGNPNGASVSFKYDATGPAVTASPSRGPDSNGWYNHGLTVGFSGSDGLSGLAACTAPQSYAGPDTASGTVNGSCTDVAGNTNGVSFPLKYDATAPSASGSPSRGPDSNGWYNHDLTINFVGDGPSGVACTGGRNYTGPDSASVTINGSCTDQAGNTGSASFTFRYDATAPSADARLTREPDSNGWYNQGLTIDFSGGDGLSGLAACAADRNYTGPDSASVTITGSCSDQAGNPSGASVSFKYDATPPDVEARPDRKPNAKGWYKSEVRVSFVGTDAISGVESCAPATTYDGPDAKNAAVSGTCRDRAANVSGEARFQLKYDTTEPELTHLRRGKLRGRGILLRWASDDASTFVVVRRPGREGARPSTVYTGREHSLVDREVTAGVKYRYTVTASDEAGNSAAKDLVVRSESSTRVTSAARPTLTRPAQGMRVSAPPLLDWEAVPKATYYNVQLFRDGKKVLTAWPAATSLRLERSWRFGGQVQRLEPGRYRWYVWPGFGKRAAGKYGKLLGSRTFVVTRG